LLGRNLRRDGRKQKRKLRLPGRGSVIRRRTERGCVYEISRRRPDGKQEVKFPTDLGMTIVCASAGLRHRRAPGRKARPDFL